MKAKEFGAKYHLVKIYYTDQKGTTRTHIEWYLRKELANLVATNIRKNKGEHYEDENICGTIKDVFTFTAKQCRFEE